MANEQNLIPNSQRTPEELREMTRKAGIASGEARRRKKRGAELMRAVLAMPEVSEDVIREMKQLGYDEPEQLSKELVMYARQVEKAIRKADTKAFKAILKAAGYDIQKVDIENLPTIIQVSSEETKDKLTAILKDNADD